MKNNGLNGSYDSMKNKMSFVVYINFNQNIRPKTNRDLTRRKIANLVRNKI